MKDYTKTFRNKTILVTGGTGSIGSEIVKHLLQNSPKQIRIFSRDETKQFYMQNKFKNYLKKDILRFLIGDVRDKERLERAMEGVEIVYHVAALKHVPFCESNPFEAIKTNVIGAQNVIDVALSKGVSKVIGISSDKAVNPNTFMGVTKLLMERMFSSVWNYSGKSKTMFSVVRFGNVLDSRGSVVPLWKEQIKNGSYITVTDKRMKRFFMSISEAVDLVFLATTIMKGNEIFVLKMKEKSIYDLAKETIKKYSKGGKIRIKIVGVRDREKIKEILFTEEESQLMIECGPLNILLPNEKIFNKRRKELLAKKIGK